MYEEILHQVLFLDARIKFTFISRSNFNFYILLLRFFCIAKSLLIFK